jgi:hypothetical protein
MERVEKMSGGECKKMASRNNLVGKLEQEIQFMKVGTNTLLDH